MYTPKHFQNHDIQAIKEFIHHNGFAVVVNQVNGKLWATHIPLLLSEDGTKLYGHVSRANNQWKSFNEIEEVLIIFNGPHAYISSSWYNHDNVPTWNYIAVHVYGTINIIEGEALKNSLKHLVDKYEKHSAQPVSVENMNAAHLDKQMKVIVGFEITIKSIEATYKLSQNRDDVNHSSIVQQLDTRDAQAKEIASAMKNTRNSSSK